MWFGRFLLWFFKPLAWLLFPFKTIGRENIPDTPGQPPLVLCCNHISVIDPVFLEMCQKRHVYFMAKEEIFKNRLATWFSPSSSVPSRSNGERGIPGHWIPPAGSLRRGSSSGFSRRVPVRRTAGWGGPNRAPR